MLPVSLDYLRPVLCDPNVANVSGLSESCVLWSQCCQWLWIIFVLCFVNPMLPVSLVASDSGLSSSCVLWSQCCQWLWIIFVLCFVNPMLPVSLDYLRPVFCDPKCCQWLWIIFVLCFVIPMCQWLWIIFVLCFVNPMLPVSLDYLRPVFCEPNVASVSGLSSSCATLWSQCCQVSGLSESCVLWSQCCQWLWIIFVLCFVNPMLPVSLDYLRPVFCDPNVASDSGLS